MLRIVGVQRGNHPDREFVLLQNQGNLRVQVRGHILTSELAILTGDLSQHAYIFRDEALVPPGMYVAIRTGFGEARWTDTKEGSRVFHAYMNRTELAWSGPEHALHILCAQHTFVDRGPALLLR